MTFIIVRIVLRFGIYLAPNAQRTERGQARRTMTTILIYKPELPGLRLGSRETPLKQELQNRVGKSKSIQQIQNRVSNRKSNQQIGNRVSKYKIDSRRTHRVQSTAR